MRKRLQYWVLALAMILTLGCAGPISASAGPILPPPVSNLDQLRGHLDRGETILLNQSIVIQDEVVLESSAQNKFFLGSYPKSEDTKTSNIPQEDRHILVKSGGHLTINAPMLTITNNIVYAPLIEVEPGGRLTLTACTLGKYEVSRNSATIQVRNGGQCTIGSNVAMPSSGQPGADLIWAQNIDTVTFDGRRKEALPIPFPGKKSWKNLIIAGTYRPDNDMSDDPSDSTADGPADTVPEVELPPMFGDAQMTTPVNGKTYVQILLAVPELPQLDDTKFLLIYASLPTGGSSEMIEYSPDPDNPSYIKSEDQGTELESWNHKGPDGVVRSIIPILAQWPLPADKIIFNLNPVGFSLPQSEIIVDVPETEDEFAPDPYVYGIIEGNRGGGGQGGLPPADGGLPPSNGGLPVNPTPTPLPRPTADPKPTANPKPTAQPKPTPQPRPSAQPKPTPQPRPTAPVLPEPEPIAPLPPRQPEPDLPTEGHIYHPVTPAIPLEVPELPVQPEVPDAPLPSSEPDVVPEPFPEQEGQSDRQPLLPQSGGLSANATELTTPLDDAPAPQKPQRRIPGFVLAMGGTAVVTGGVYAGVTMAHSGTVAAAGLLKRWLLRLLSRK